MEQVKLAIIYYSSTGTNYKMARAAEEAARVSGADVRLRRVKELAPDTAIDRNPAWRANVEETKDVQEASLDDLEWADAYLFGSPTRFGNMTAQMRQFMDQTGGLWGQGKLANKVACGFTSAQNPHGGQESTLLSMYHTFYHWGCIVVTPGYTDASVFPSGGNPYGVSTTYDGHTEIGQEILDSIRYMTKRVLTVARWIKAGRTAS